MGLNVIICIKCEINKAKDYTFTLLAKQPFNNGPEDTIAAKKIIRTFSSSFRTVGVGVFFEVVMRILTIFSSLEI